MRAFFPVHPEKKNVLNLNNGGLVQMNFLFNKQVSLRFKSRKCSRVYWKKATYLLQETRSNPPGVQEGSESCTQLGKINISSHQSSVWEEYSCSNQEQPSTSKKCYNLLYKHLVDIEKSNLALFTKTSFNNTGREEGKKIASNHPDSAWSHVKFYPTPRHQV